MKKSKTSFFSLLKHFHTLLAVMTATIIAALLLPVGIHFAMTLLGQGVQTTVLYQLVNGLSFGESAALCLVACLILNMPLACSAFQRGCEEMRSGQ